MKQRKKIICIANDVWRDSDKIWGFNTFLKNGFDVEIWKVGEITIGIKIWEKTHFKILSIQIHTWKQFYSMILKQKISKTIFLFYGIIPEFDKAKALIKILHGKYCVAAFGPLINQQTLLQKERIKNIKHHWMDFFPASYNFLGSELHKGQLHSHYEACKKNNILLHTFNYDYYLLNEKLNCKINKNYILFLDQNFISHKDQVNFGIKRYIPNSDIYIKEMRSFLDYVEEFYKLPIIIAAHPTSDVSISEVYGNREMVYGDTCNYVKYSKFVISCTSGSLDWAVLYKKPILFWNCDQIKKGYLYPVFQLPKVKKLHGKIFNISNLRREECLDDYMTGVDYFEQYEKYIAANKSDKLCFEKVVIYLKNV